MQPQSLLIQFRQKIWRPKSGLALTLKPSRPPVLIACSIKADITWEWGYPKEAIPSHFALFTLERHSNAHSVCVIIIMVINTADCHWNGDWLIILAILFISLGWVTGWPSPRRGGLWQRMQASRMRTRLTSMTLGTRWTRGGGRRAARSKDKSMGGIELAPDWFLSQFFSACKVFQSSLSNLFCYSCCKRSLSPHYEPHPL